MIDVASSLVVPQCSCCCDSDIIENACTCIQQHNEATGIRTPTRRTSCLLEEAGKALQKPSPWLLKEWWVPPAIFAAALLRPSITACIADTVPLQNYKNGIRPITLVEHIRLRVGDMPKDCCRPTPQRNEISEQAPCSTGNLRLVVPSGLCFHSQCCLRTYAFHSIKCTVK